MTAGQSARHVPMRTCELCERSFPKLTIKDVWCQALGRYVGVCESPSHHDWLEAQHRTDPARSKVAAFVHGPALGWLALVAAVLLALVLSGVIL